MELRATHRVVYVAALMLLQISEPRQSRVSQTNIVCTKICQQINAAEN